MEIWKQSATALARAIRDRKLSSREVVQAHLDRIAEVNGEVNAVVAVLAEQALQQAEAADRALGAGRSTGPLHGVPMTVKENIDLRGSATTQGVVAMKEAMPELDAPHIKQLLEAGAIPIGRTNLPDFGLRWHTDNALRGATRNPWDRGRSTGGSSGGDAVALATGMTPLGNGNDYGGSLRLPSQFCGTCALKPTLGRVPWASALMPEEPPITLQLFAVQGPMARHVNDLRLAISAMTDRDARDPWWTPAAPLAEPASGSRAVTRVAVVPDPAGKGVHEDVAWGVRRAADALRDAGYQVEEVEPPAIGEAAELWASVVFTEIREFWLPRIGALVSNDARRFLELALEPTPALDLRGYMQALAERQRLARQWSQFFETYPLVVGPVCTQPPFAVGRDTESVEAVQELLRSQRLLVSVNLLGLPAVAIPVGVRNGLPQGVQVIGDRYDEVLCLDAAQGIEDRLGVITPIDPT